MSDSTHKVSVYEIVLLTLYFFVFIFFSFFPAFRVLWCIENSISFFLLGVIIWLRFSGMQWSKTALMIVLFACISQTLGGYFTFQKVPGGELLSLLGHTGRNNFDRLGHFLCGFLSFPLLEYLQKENADHKILNGVFAVLTMSGIAALYEEFEWGVVQITEARTGLTYIGMQGDEWDAQADMFCCSIGAIAGVLLFGAQHWIESWRMREKTSRG